eukprot:2493636-Amphidinium_carterae.1
MMNRSEPNASLHKDFLWGMSGNESDAGIGSCHPSQANTYAILVLNLEELHINCTTCLLPPPRSIAAMCLASCVTTLLWFVDLALNFFTGRYSNGQLRMTIQECVGQTCPEVGFAPARYTLQSTR